MSMARVRERGQITLPLAVRVALGASTGTDLLFVPAGAGLFTVRRLARPDPLLDLLDDFADEGPAPDLHAFDVVGGDGWVAPFAPEETA